MRQSFSIRQVLPGEGALLRAMSATLGEAFGEIDTYTAAPPSDTYLERLLAGDGFIALTAEKDGQIVGGLAAYELHKFEQQRSEIYVYDLAVAEEHRRQGIATALLQELKRVAAERGSYVMFIQADRGDEPAVALYRKLGREEDVLHFDIDVS